MSNLPSTIDLLQLGADAQAAAGATNESTKVGTLRAGNTGVIAFGDTPVNVCARTTFLRYKGIDADKLKGPEVGSRELMFEGGRKNEDSWTELFASAAVPGMTMKREEEVPIAWAVDGVPVTGRPDLVLFLNGTPVRGIELKQVSAVNTARIVGLNLEPKLSNLMQAAHYAWQVGVPYELWYTSRVDWAIPSWLDKSVNGKEYAPHVEGILERGTRGIKKIRPFVQGYSVEWNSKGQLEWAPLNEAGQKLTQPIQTLVTIDGIVNYYKTVIAQASTNKLAKRPLNLKVNGEKESWSLCDYCPLQSTCDVFENSTTEEWLNEVQRLLLINNAK